MKPADIHPGMKVHVTSAFGANNAIWTVLVAGGKKVPVKRDSDGFECTVSANRVRPVESK